MDYILLPQDVSVLGSYKNVGFTKDLGLLQPLSDCLILKKVISTRAWILT